MTKALRNLSKPLAYLVAIGCLATFAVLVYRTLKPGDAPATRPAGAIVSAPSTNLPAGKAGETNEVAAAPPAEERRSPSPDLGKVVAYGGLGLLSLIGLALLISRDVSRYVANRADDFIFNDNLVGVYNPEYEEAERVWTNGQYLDAIQLMRDYLKKHPREQYVALRIAEIYETNLGNYLAAALEYEEILKKRLPSERWGWAAIHLANLYSGKLNKVDEATALLHRIMNEYGQTAAARKARERLGLPEPVTEEQVQLAPPEPEPPKPAPAPPPSNLPPGFRPK
jgi:TolA-binding protein